MRPMTYTEWRKGFHANYIKYIKNIKYIFYIFLSFSSHGVTEPRSHLFLARRDQKRAQRARCTRFPQNLSIRGGNPLRGSRDLPKGQIPPSSFQSDGGISQLSRVGGHFLPRNSRKRRVAALLSEIQVAKESIIWPPCGGQGPGAGKSRKAGRVWCGVWCGEVW